MQTHPNKFHLHKGRIEALSDAVFAIVLTLLVLELKVPELSRSDALIRLNEQVAHLQPLFFGYVVTFIIGGVFWYLQCVSLQLLTKMTPILATINLIFLGFVSLLPFSMSLWSRYQELSMPNVFYFGNFLSISTALGLYWAIAQRHGLVPRTEHAMEIRRLNWRIFSMPLASVIGLTVAFWSPSRAIYVFAAIMILSRFGGIAVDRRSAQQ